MQTPTDKTPDLAPPGAGVPALQRFFGRRVLLPWWCLRLSWVRALDTFDAQAAELLSMASGHDEARLTRRILVPQLIGLEDSSRFYSYAMVLEHLTVVGRGTAAIVVALSRAKLPPGAMRTEDLKPAGGIPATAAMAEYRNMVSEFRRSITRDVVDRRSRRRFDHPWFGPLSAHQWLCFAPFHQSIHTRQARAILGT